MALLTLDLTLQSGFGHHSDCQIKESKLPHYFGAMNAQVWRRTKNPLLWPDFVYVAPRPLLTRIEWVEPFDLWP
jgi:hypothetical protein